MSLERRVLFEKMLQARPDGPLYTPPYETDDRRR
jgi:hypothetical protein